MAQTRAQREAAAAKAAEEANDIARSSAPPEGTGETTPVRTIAYVGPSHVRSISAADLISLGVPANEAEDITFDRRINSSIEVGAATYDALIALKDWKGN